MEVHQHTHTPRKRWTHYFWEFIMLFLAVFCGFLAENQREHFIEHQREKQYARTLHEDLKADTAILRAAILQNEYVTQRIDTFRALLRRTEEINAIPSGTWYYYGRFGTRNFQISLQDATLEQLKSSGGLRYFKNKDVVRAIARYDQTCRHMQISLDLQSITYNELIKTRNQIFDASYMDPIMDFNLTNINVDSFMSASPPLLSLQKKDFIQYSNNCQLRSYNNKFLLRQKEAALKNAEELITILAREYNLK